MEIAIQAWRESHSSSGQSQKELVFKEKLASHRPESPVRVHSVYAEKHEDYASLYDPSPDPLLLHPRSPDADYRRRGDLATPPSDFGCFRSGRARGYRFAPPLV